MSLLIVGITPAIAIRSSRITRAITIRSSRITFPLTVYYYYDT